MVVSSLSDVSRRGSSVPRYPGEGSVGSVRWSARRAEAGGMSEVGAGEESGREDKMVRGRREAKSPRVFSMQRAREQ